MTKHRLEAFSDGVIAIIVTIMVLNIPLPKTFKFNDIMQLIGAIMIFFISFFLVGFYWHQHYRLFMRLKEVSNVVVWRNMLFLFSLSLMPIFTKWIVGNFGELVPAIAYVIIFMGVNLSFQLLFASVTKDQLYLDLGFTGKFSLKRFFITLSIIAVLIIFSIVATKIASFLLIALPVILSLSNLWIEHDHNRLKKNHYKKIEKIENKEEKPVK